MPVVSVWDTLFSQFLSPFTLVCVYSHCWISVNRLQNWAVCLINFPVAMQCFVCPDKQSCLLNVCLCDFSSRYSIDKRSDTTKAFKIDPNNGTLTVTKALDRETRTWNNVTIEAKETSKVFIWPTYCTSCFLLFSLPFGSEKAVKCQCPLFWVFFHSQDQRRCYIYQS